MAGKTFRHTISSKGCFIAYQRKIGESAGTRGILMIVCWLVTLTVTGQPLRKGLAFAEDFKSLPILKKGVQVYQFSSTDPKEDQFNDYFHWLYTQPDSGAVLADIKGPGAMYRLWSTGNSGDSNRLKIFIDGEEKPSINETFNHFHDKKPLRDRPQVGAGGDKYLAWWSYMPITFKKSLKVVREGNFRPFYNITWHSYTDTQGVKSWTGKEDYSVMEKMWSNPATQPDVKKVAVDQNKTVTIDPGQSLTLVDHKGAGYVATLRIGNYKPDKDLVLRIYWDNEAHPSVEAPVKWFFGSIDNGGDLQALGVGTVNNNGYCYFPMPFWKRARIELVNTGSSPATEITTSVTISKEKYDEASSGYFHTRATEVDKPNGKFTCLQTTGRGHVVGMAKRMPKGGHACEADEIFYIDGRQFPDIYGTGEEDYANCAWWKNLYNSYPTHGAIGNDCYYRIHYPDLIVYEQSLDMQFEAWQNYYTSSVVWYYETDNVSLVPTDSLDIGDTKDEQKHQYTASATSWSGEKTGSYPGKRVHQYTATDNGRASSGSSFVVKLKPNNNGARLRVRTEHINGQAVKVFVDGVEVKERPWVIMKNNYEALWIDSDFEIPANYTKNKTQLKITLEKLPGSPDWREYRYQVFSYQP